MLTVEFRREEVDADVKCLVRPLELSVLRTQLADLLRGLTDNNGAARGGPRRAQTQCRKVSVVSIPKQASKRLRRINPRRAQT
jgi:hypothetical protein